ncbi:ribonuclease domain-containing protein [Nocardia stercoris]|uniref:Ribonuclease n=1 Tax=Nocardia stercoris TaxID=2483361 RepID=A0A3M2KXY9_9NOCA|nr:ribonuclease domain-containing protein [Nocardia stercoris]RMI30379.1 ribonuclease [Nocardia stercoris]
MTHVMNRAATFSVAVLCASVVLTGVAAGPAGADPAACGDTSGYTLEPLSALPPEAATTVGEIEQGGPYPYRQDDTVFSNRQGVLPACATGYYHEFTVVTPGAPTRGTRRIVTGGAGEFFYTGDHYNTFVTVDITR